MRWTANNISGAGTLGGGFTLGDGADPDDAARLIEGTAREHEHDAGIQPPAPTPSSDLGSFAEALAADIFVKPARPAIEARRRGDQLFE
jgi:hypothetical protein